MAEMLTHTGARFEWRGDYTTRAAPKAAGFRWDPAARCWATTDAALAGRLATEADAAARARLAAHATAVAASRAEDATVEVPAPDGLAYLPFQRAGIAYAQTRPGVLFGDDMGLGKTIQALGVLNADPALRRVLVVCPASLRINWEREARKWLVTPRRIAHMLGGVVPSAAEADLVIASYDAAWENAAALRAEPWDAVICDEAHYLRNPGADRTRAVFGGKLTKTKAKARENLAKKRNRPMQADPGTLAPLETRRWILLTGTPIPNRPIELWPLVQRLDPQGLGASWFAFITRYCAGYRGQWGWEVDGASNLDELQVRLRGAFMVRRLKTDVLDELPAKRRQVVVLPAGTAERAVAAENAAWAAREARLVDLRAAVAVAEASDDPAVYREAMAALTTETREAFTAMARLRHATAVAKIPYVVDFAREALGAGEKLVLFAHHHDVVDGLMAGLADFGAVALTGEMPLGERQAAVDRFQADPTCRVFVGSIQAAGVGLTLTAAHHVIFAELDWVPGNVTQAEDRCHRIGQRDTVLVQHLVLAESLDARMAEVLIAKQDVCDRALDREGAVAQLAVPEVAPGGGDATGRAGLDTVAVRLSATQIAAIHGGLRLLAGACDGASTWDGTGYSKLDARIGHALAEAPTLTPRQAALGRKVLAKYRRTQLPAALVAAIWPADGADEAA